MTLDDSVSQCLDEFEVSVDGKIIVKMGIWSGGVLGAEVLSETSSRRRLCSDKAE